MLTMVKTLREDNIMENINDVKNMTHIVQEDKPMFNEAIQNISDKDFRGKIIDVREKIKSEGNNNYMDDNKTTNSDLKEIINLINYDSSCENPHFREDKKYTGNYERFMDLSVPNIQVKDEVKNEENNHLSENEVPKNEIKEEIITVGLKDNQANQNSIHSHITKDITCRDHWGICTHDLEIKVKEEIMTEDNNIDKKNFVCQSVWQPTNKGVIDLKEDNNNTRMESACESDNEAIKEITINSPVAAKSHKVHKDRDEENLQVSNATECLESSRLSPPAFKDYNSADIKLLQKPIVILVDLKDMSPSSKKQFTSNRGILAGIRIKTINDDKEIEKAQNTESSKHYFEIDGIEIDDENGLFNCTLCDFKSVHRRSCINHQLIHSNKRSFSCNQCEYKGKRKKDLQVHIRSHVLSYPYKCNLCNYKGKVQKYFKTHMLRHTNPDLFKCLICNKGFTVKGNLTAHVKYTHESKHIFNCEFCNFTSKRKTSLNFHVNVVHKKMHIFKCTSCSYSTARKGDLSRHTMKHTGIKPFGCSQCSFKCTNSGTLKSHMRTHTGERPFLCSLCNKRFKMKGTLNEHMESHTAFKEFHCSKCDYATTSGKRLKHHLKSHEDEKPYKCSSCSYAGKTTSNLKEHMKFHSGKFIACELCDYKTPNMTCMKSHMQTHKGIKPFKCDMCDYAGRSKSYLEGHLKSEHNGTKSKKKLKPKDQNFPCDKCSFVAASFGYFRNHLKLKHGITDF